MANQTCFFYLVSKSADLVLQEGCTSDVSLKVQMLKQQIVISDQNGLNSIISLKTLHIYNFIWNI